MKLSTKQKGCLTELQCITACCELGLSVSIPYGDNDRYDFIVDTGKQLLRIQVKTSHWMDDDCSSFSFNTRSTNVNTKGSRSISYDENDIDFFATFIQNQCYLIPVCECLGGSTKTLRVAPPKNNQSSFVNYADNYTIERQLALVA